MSWFKKKEKTLEDIIDCIKKEYYDDQYDIVKECQIDYTLLNDKPHESLVKEIIRQTDLYLAQINEAKFMEMESNLIKDHPTGFIHVEGSISPNISKDFWLAEGISVSKKDFEILREQNELFIVKKQLVEFKQNRIEEILIQIDNLEKELEGLNK